MRLGINGFHGAQAMPNENNALVYAALQKLDPRGHVQPAVIDDFISRAKAASHIADACTKDRIVAAGIDGENREARILQTRNQRFEGA